ncbi:unannotated protein [freshwater metagenome]|uniref:Unannotated protein n=1 Tax=freshwater metagenome TaxID=449393 RepID=A0A6J7Q2A0_9ZZZZ
MVPEPPPTVGIGPTDSIAGRGEADAVAMPTTAGATGPRRPAARAVQAVSAVERCTRIRMGPR